MGLFILVGLIVAITNCIFADEIPLAPIASAIESSSAADIITDAPTESIAEKNSSDWVDEYNPENDNEFGPCTSRDNEPNTISGTLKCKPSAQFYGGNTINGQLFLDNGVVFQGRSAVQSFSDVFVGRDTQVGPLSAFNNHVQFGRNNRIGSDCIFNMLRTGNDVTIGSNGFLSGTFASGARIGARCTTLRGSFIEEDVILGNGVLLGERSHVLAGLQVGDGCCIGDGVQVNIDVPADSIWNNDETIRSITKSPGTTIARVSGRCVEQIRKRL